MINTKGNWIEVFIGEWRWSRLIWFPCLHRNGLQYSRSTLTTQKQLFLCFLKNEMILRNGRYLWYDILWSSWLLFTFCGLDVTLPGPRCVPWSCQYQSPSMPSVSMSQYQCQYQYTSSYYKSQKRNTISRWNQQYLGPNIWRLCDFMTQKWNPVIGFEFDLKKWKIWLFEGSMP